MCPEAGPQGRGVGLEAGHQPFYGSAEGTEVPLLALMPHWQASRSRYHSWSMTLKIAVSQVTLKQGIQPGSS